MTKDELMALGLDSDKAQKVIDDQAKNFVAKSRFNEVNEAKKGLEKQLSDQNKQLEDLKKTAGDNEALNKQIQDLQTANKEAQDKFDAQIRQMRIDHAVEDALNHAKARNLKAVRALLDLDKAELDEDGHVKGLDKQIKALTDGEDTKFLFNIQEEQKKDEGKPKTNFSGLHILNPQTPANGGGDGSNLSLGAQFAARYNAINNPSQTPENGKE